MPDDIREALVSEETSDFLWKTCEVEHIPDAKIYTVARLAGYVLFGFLHPEDLAAELRDALTIDIRIASAIANAINQRIFAPLRPQIDAVYKPIVAGTSSVASGLGPKILEEIRPIMPVGARPMSGLAFARVGEIGTVPPRPTQPVSSLERAPQNFGAGVNQASRTVAGMGMGSVPLPPKPSVFSNLQKTESGKIPLPPKPPQPESRIENRESSGGMGIRTAPSRPLDGGIPSSVPAPMPVFIQSDAATRPLANVPDFKLKSTDQFAALTSAPPAPAKPAIIEFGIPKPPKPVGNSVPLPPMPAPSASSPKSVGSPVPLPPMPPGK